MRQRIAARSGAATLASGDKANIGRSGHLRSGFILGIGQAVIRATVAAYSILLIHGLSRVDYGDFAFAAAVLAISITVADGGFSRLLIRDVARSSVERPHIIRPLLALRAAWVSVVAVGVAAASYGGVLGFRGALLVAMLAALVLEALATGFEAAGIGAERPVRVAAGQLVASLSLVLFATIALFAPLTTALAVAGLAVAAAAKLAWHLQSWRDELRYAGGRVGRVDVAQWIRQAAPYLAMSGLGTLYYRIDVVILHTRAGASETASYAAAYRVVDAVLVAGGVAAAAIAPHLSRVHRDQPSRVWSEWRRYFARTAAVAVPLVVVLFLVAEPLSRFIFGAQYANSASQDLRLLAPGIAFMLLHTINLSVLFTGDDTRLLLPISIGLVLMNIVLTWSLVGLAESAGAAAATSLAELITVVIFAAFLHHRFRPSAST